MRLIRVFGISRKLGQIPPNACGGRKMEKTLKAQHGLEHLRAIAHRCREATCQSATAQIKNLRLAREIVG
jgi:hypothetical protein